MNDYGALLRKPYMLLS